MSDARTILAVDVGGSHVKALLSTESEPRRFDSGSTLSGKQMVAGLRKVTEGWSWDVATIGIPTLVAGGRPVSEPVNLGKGWVGLDYEAALGVPTKVVNDAAMQALGSYEGGRMLFLSLGTGLGSALIVDGAVEPLELGHLPFRKRTFEDYVGDAARKRRGKKKWKEAIFEVVEHFSDALQPEYVMIGGGNVERLDELPRNARRGDNENAFVGGFRLWNPQWVARPHDA